MITRLTSTALPHDARDLARRQLALRRPEALVLVLLLIEDGDDDGALQGPDRMRRLAGQLRLCADIPELVEELGCSAEAVDPALMRAAATLLSDAARVAWI
jgi:hypothetical protein